jgi:DNA polymerase-3 subunit delta
MTFEQIIKDLKNKIYKPVYFLTGDEPYYVDKITDYISEHVLTDEEKTFNQIILYGKDTDIFSVINTARRFPMLAGRQVVIVKEAQDIPDIDNLIYYVENPLKSTILVINYKYRKTDKRKKIYTAIQKNGVFFESKKLYDYQIPEWINKYLAERNHKIDPGAGLLLTEYLGNDLSKIVNEIEKLKITLPPDNNKITLDHIEKYIGISKDYNNFELHKALSQKNILKTNRIINYFSKNQKENPINLTISSLYYYFSRILKYHFIKDKTKQNIASTLKVHPYFITEYKSAAQKYNPKKLVEILSVLREFDIKSKGIGNISASPGDLLKEMIYKILH